MAIDSDMPLVCTSCGYDLAATPHDSLCPECGTHVSSSITARFEARRRLTSLMSGAQRSFAVTWSIVAVALVVAIAQDPFLTEILGLLPSIPERTVGILGCVTVLAMLIGLFAILRMTKSTVCALWPELGTARRRLRWSVLILVAAQILSLIRVSPFTQDSRVAHILTLPLAIASWFLLFSIIEFQEKLAAGVGRTVRHTDLLRRFTAVQVIAFVLGSVQAAVTRPAVSESTGSVIAPALLPMPGVALSWLTTLSTVLLTVLTFAIARRAYSLASAVDESSS